MKIESNYFSPSYFARDVIHSTSTFLIVIICTIIACDLGDNVISYFKAIPDIKEFVTIFVSVLPGFILLAIICGFITNGIFISIRDLYFRFRKKYKYHQFDTHYLKNATAIESLHYQYFKDLPKMKIEEETDNSTMVNDLLSLFKQINPSGYISIGRSFSLLAVYRQLSIYSILLSIIELLYNDYILFLLFIILTLFFIHGNNRLVRQTARLEFTFILGSAANLKLKKIATISEEDTDTNTMS